MIENIFGEVNSFRFLWKLTKLKRKLNGKNGLFVKNGDSFWYKDGYVHRDDGPAAEYANGNKFWFKFGKCHREDGPAVIWNNGEFWYKNDLKHRENGPAVIWENGSKEYWYNGKQFNCKTTEEFLRLIKLEIF